MRGWSLRTACRRPRAAGRLSVWSPRDIASSRHHRRPAAGYNSVSRAGGYKSRPTSPIAAVVKNARRSSAQVMPGSVEMLVVGTRKPVEGEARQRPEWRGRTSVPVNPATAPTTGNRDPWLAPGYTRTRAACAQLCMACFQSPIEYDVTPNTKHARRRCSTELLQSW